MQKIITVSGSMTRGYCAMLLSTLLLAACGGGGGGDSTPPPPPPPPTYSLSATFVKGMVTGATCQLFQVSAEGVKGALVATSTTAAGLTNFGSNIQYQGTGIIECTGGTYTDEATGSSLTAPLLRALVNISGNGAFVVSPLTEIAVQLAEASGNLGTALTVHNSAVATAFGLIGNITTQVPTDLNSTGAANNAAGQYGTALALIAQLNQNLPGSLSTLLGDLVADLTDGSFSGGTLANLGTALADLSSSAVAANINSNAVADMAARAGIPTDGGGDPGADQPNILLIISDDQGVDSSAEYDFSLDPPTTPTLSALAAEGIVFQNLWATPTCAPTRAAILTGKHGIRNGVLTVPGDINEADELIYEYLAANADTQNYASAYIGKWHLGTASEGSNSNPVVNGIPYFAGSVQGNIADYHSWDLTIDSADTAAQTTLSTGYNTTVLTNLAIDWVAAQSSPWMLTLAYNAPHAPLHWPDPALHTRTGYTGADCANPPGGTNETKRECFLAMIEAMDTEIGNLLDSLSDTERANTIVIFVGDNGTANTQRDPLVFGAGQVKGTLFEGGLRVPMIVSGAQVTRVNAREDRLVTVTDIYATIAELAGASFQGALHDSISFAGFLNTAQGERRQYAFADYQGETEYGWTIRNQSHQLIHDQGQQTLHQLHQHSFDTIDVTASAPDTLFELIVQSALVRNVLGLFSAQPTGPARDITHGGEHGTYSVRASTCARYVKDYTASATNRNGTANNNDDVLFTANLSIDVVNGLCNFTTNGIPNHDMQDTANFANPVATQNDIYRVTATPQFTGTNFYTTVTQEQGIYLNGVKIDLFAAACLGVGNERVGCGPNTVPPATEWRFDPMFAGSAFQTDSHNAHTQPNGAYHYHGSPNALFDLTGATESGTVGFAADGFPIYGLYILDQGEVREVQSSYQLKAGNRPVLNLGGTSAQHSEQPYDGTFRQDYEYVAGSGDLDECNGMFRDGTYGYYVTNGYPYIVGCFKGTPHASFVGGAGGGAANFNVMH